MEMFSKNKAIFLFVVLLGGSFCVYAGRDMMSDTWTAVDGLGRALKSDNEYGPVRKDRAVGIYYFQWFGAHGYGQHSDPTDAGEGVLLKTEKDYKGPYDITEILKCDPNERPWGPPESFHHWGQSEMGYYLSNDEYVIRKHCQMLVDAGVDVLILDVTNGYTYRDTYFNICRIFRDIRSHGEQTPQIAFIVNTKSVETVQKLYDEFYSKKLYPELWFYWKGKPLLLSPFEGLSQEIRDFFCLRRSWAWSRESSSNTPQPWFGDGKDKWPWIDTYPQQPGWHESPDKPETISVSVASHPINNIGRSFHDGKQPASEDFRTYEGLNFIEQWKRALEVDPEFVFITGWNEWVAMRIINEGQVKKLLGKPIGLGDHFFVDTYNEEYSRDIEPMKDGYGDAYYYQMVDNIRQYKGVRPLPKASPAKRIVIDGSFDEWADVAPEYRDSRCDTFHRDHPGWGRIKSYVNDTGRNDFVTCKVARDCENLYFYVETAEAITHYQDKNWMLLFIDADGDHSTGWKGYDYLINHEVVDPKNTIIEKFESSNQLSKIGDIKYCVNGNKLELGVPRKLLGLEGKSRVAVNFHWADNIQSLFDITEFALNGDSAPNRRFNYFYREEPGDEK